VVSRLYTTVRNATTTIVIAIEWLELPLRILQVPSSNIDPETFHGFFQSSRHAGVVPLILLNP